jgi:hypothetical protein
MKKLFLLVLLSLGIPAFAEDLYYAQSAAGAANGSSCGNAIALSNIAWGSSAGQIGAGDTAHLCGTLTSTLTVGGSGSSGSIITIKFEDGAKFSKTAWGTGSAAAIYANGKDYIIIDGGTNGIIENTDNGTAKAYQQASHGINVSSCNNLEIKNVTIQNIYIRTSGSTDYTNGTGGLEISGGSSIYVHDNAINEAVTLITATIPNGQTVSNWYFYNNTLTNSQAGIIVGSGGSNAVLNTVEVYGNTINLGNHFSYPSSDHYHGDGIHFWAVHSGAHINGSKIYNNTIGPKTLMKTSEGNTATTAWVFIEGKTTNCWVYNNIFLSDTGYYPSNGYVTFKGGGWGATGSKAYNNTINAVGGGSCFYIDSDNASAEIKNNICLSSGYSTNLSGELTNKNQMSYNVYYGSSGWNANNLIYNWAQWTALGYDANSQVAQPLLDSSYAPMPEDTVTREKGTNLSPYFSTDFNGNARPSSGTWDIGAYEYGAGGSIGGGVSAPGGVTIR